VLDLRLSASVNYVEKSLSSSAIELMRFATPPRRKLRFQTPAAANCAFGESWPLPDLARFPRKTPYFTASGSAARLSLKRNR